jgi:exonuclease III
MKILSYNIRSLGGVEKRKEILHLIREKKHVVVCIQESKMEKVDEFLINSLWGSNEVGFSFRPSVGASGGIITIWDLELVEVEFSVSFNHALIVGGRLKKENFPFGVVNVYAPCDSRGKQELWARLCNFLHHQTLLTWCVCGDFNDVRSEEERKGRLRMGRSDDFADFNKFIEDAMLNDLPLAGRHFTWFRGDGISMSRLDRFLLSEDWCLTWQNCYQITLVRGLSDHCPILLLVDDEN